MCKFFSLISDGTGKVYYFDAAVRKQIIAGTLKDRSGNVYETTDSHSSIASYYKLIDDHCNKWEYNPLTGLLERDQINTVDDFDAVNDFCKALDFKTVVPELIIHPIIHPFRDVSAHEVAEKDIVNLRQWASVTQSVRESAGASAWESVGASAWESVGESVGKSVRESVWGSVWESAGASVGESVRESAGASAWRSVRESVWAYISSYFDLQQWKYIDHAPGENPYQPLIDLWNRGFVPSYGGKTKTWRLHQGKDAKIVYEWVRATVE
jgi:hypothetical protein